MGEALSGFDGRVSPPAILIITSRRVGDPSVERSSEVWSEGRLDPEARQDFDLLPRDLPRPAESVCRLLLEPPACGDAIVASSSSSLVMGITFLV